jgi:sterol desaturase/sphingolipid hydroxylase (fatty acid hydroxylase superfamily)
MDVADSIGSIMFLVVAMAVFGALERILPLRDRTRWNRAHLTPNLTLTAITYAINLLLNIAVLIGLQWLAARNIGLLNVAEPPVAVALIAGVAALDLGWYVTHRTMHSIAGLWPFHAVHHSDLAVDVTTTVRQHPGEVAIRFVILVSFAAGFGVSPLAFAIYRVWSVLHGMLEHANISLPAALDSAICWLFTSPNMHKVHHACQRPLTDSNYGNILSLWDRLFGTFVPPKYGIAVCYGLDDGDAAQQSTVDLLVAPFRYSGPSRARGKA